MVLLFQNKKLGFPMIDLRVVLVVAIGTVTNVQGFSIRRLTQQEHRYTSVPMQMAANQDSKQRILQVDDPTRLRNIALVGHSHCGKTALAEWMLYDEAILTKTPTSGQSSLDSDPIEAARHSSVFSHFLKIPHGPCLLEVTDTPWGDFPSDAMASLDGCDAAVLVVSAADGVQVGTLQAHQHCKSSGIPTLLALSKMDRPFLQVTQVLQDIKQVLGVTPVPLQVCIGTGNDLKDVVPLFVLDKSGELTKNTNAGEVAEDAWLELEEAVAMTNDDLLVEYLESGELSHEQVIQGLRIGIRQNKIVPLVYTSAELDVGVKELMDAMVGVLPNPIEMRDEAIRLACESEAAKCTLEPGVESGFAARVLHTTVDSFGSLSVLRIISNNRQGNDAFASLPSEVCNLRTNEKLKLASVATSFALCGKERVSLSDGASIVPGDVIAVPKLSDAVSTNDILVAPESVESELDEITIEQASTHLTPLSRPIREVALMTSATVELNEGKQVKGKKTGGDDKLLAALRSMAREDLAVRFEHDVNTGKLLLHCMSQDHLQLLGIRLKDRFDLDVSFGRPPVQYRETLKKAVKNVEGRHKKQSGGSGQFGVCVIDMEPLEEGSGIEFESKIKGGVISKPFISSVEKGVREQLKVGGPLGFPVVDVKVTLVDGKMHSVDSKDIAFQSAGKLAVKEALARGKTKLLQPMEDVTFTVNEAMQGEVSAIIARNEGYVTNTGPSSDGVSLEIRSILPSAVIGDVSDVLRAASAGEAQFVSKFSHYQPVSDDLAASIVGSDDGKVITK